MIVGKRRYLRHTAFLGILMLGGVVTYCRHAEKSNDAQQFIVQRMYDKRPASETVKVVLDWKEVAARTGVTKATSFVITDLNFGKKISPFLIDENSDNVPDQLVFDFEFSSTEPIFSFSLKPAIEFATLSKEKVQVDGRLRTTWLTSYTDFSKNNSVTSLPDKIIQSTIDLYPDPVQFPIYAPNRWNYEYGFFLNGTFLRWQETKNEAYFNYIKTWVDRFVDANGKLDTIQYRPHEYKLDDVLPGRLLVSLYEITKDERYKKAADQLIEQLKTQPKTSEGGYWHKEVYPYQMWLDGIYMADVFSQQYAKAFNTPELIDEAIHQIKLISKYTTDPTTGLMYHGWDESKNKVWAHPERGTSPEFWGRAIGWYMMALVESLDYIPANHPERKDVEAILQKLAAAVLKYQDKHSKLWYQVLDKGDKPGNWIETSCSAMFTYAFAKGNRLGILSSEYRSAAEQAFQGLLKDYVLFDDKGILYLNRTVKIGTLNPKGSKGDFDYYISTECRINDYKGLAALLYASLELDNQLTNKN